MIVLKLHFAKREIEQWRGCALWQPIRS